MDRDQLTGLDDLDRLGERMHLERRVFGGVGHIVEFGADADRALVGDAPLENTTDPNRISFLVTGVYKFRVGVRRSGSTDTITNADLSLRKDGVNA